MSLAQAQTKIEKSNKDIAAQIRDHKTRAATLEKKAETLKTQSGLLRTHIITLAQDITSIDEKRDRLEGRLAQLRASAKTLTKQLQNDRQHLAQTLAGLQNLQNNPPPVFLIEPNDALAAIRGALLMAQIVPFTQKRAQVVRARLTELTAIRVRVREQSIELEAAEQSAQTKHQALMIALQDKAQAEKNVRQQAAAQAQTIALLVKKARNLRDLTQQLQKRLQNKQESKRQTQKPPPIVDSAFSKARGQIALPVAGTIDGYFGAPDASGSPRHGLAIAARGGAQIIAPYDGEILYAGVFRHYGNIVILRIDSHYQVILAGLDNIEGYVGQSILAGEPLGQLPSNRPEKNKTRQQLYMELRYEGEPIDPTIWLQARYSAQRK
ncbi:MAG: peptidoglycan DD-metalloendopeptidase family protein [Alphaproteobacteria bacterium]|nr:peptidoglycan DD-metalloendopeptidase family protein [Alphaproteobacteria bacterium]